MAAPSGKSREYRKGIALKLSSRGRYAVMAVCDLVVHSDGRPVSLAGIADRQGLSLSYLEQLFARLRRAEVVRSVRGPGGGYLPARAPEAISIAEIVQAVEVSGPGAEAGPDAGPPARLAGDALTRDLWQRLGQQIRSYLTGISVADVIDGRLAEPVTGRAQPRRELQAAGG